MDDLVRFLVDVYMSFYMKAQQSFAVSTVSPYSSGLSPTGRFKGSMPRIQNIPFPGGGSFTASIGSSRDLEDSIDSYDDVFCAVDFETRNPHGSSLENIYGVEYAERVKSALVGACTGNNHSDLTDLQGVTGVSDPDPPDQGFSIVNDELYYDGQPLDSPDPNAANLTPVLEDGVLNWYYNTESDEEEEEEPKDTVEKICMNCKNYNVFTTICKVKKDLVKANGTCSSDFVKA